MIFKIGKYYKHTSNQMMHIISGAKTTLYGWSLIAEVTKTANLHPVGSDEDSAINWEESTKEEWMKNFSK